MNEDWWSYDGSFEGLLLLADRALEEDYSPLVASPVNRGGNDLFVSADKSAAIAETMRDEASVDAAISRIRSLSVRLYAAIARAWMSEEGIETALLAVVVAVGRMGESALGDFSMVELRTLAASVRRVNREIHRLEGFARFSLNPAGRYVAVLEPDHNVLPALAPYFAQRFGDDPFALVDARRGYALASRFAPHRDSRCEADDSAWEGKPVAQPPFLAYFGEDALDLIPDDREGDAAALWQKYFAATENPARKNPKLQRQLMPSRYWRHLTEMK